MVKNLHAAEFDNDAVGDEERRTTCTSSKTVGVVTLWIPYAEKLCLAVGRNTFEKYDKPT